MMTISARLDFSNRKGIKAVIVWYGSTFRPLTIYICSITSDSKGKIGHTYVHTNFLKYVTNFLNRCWYSHQLQRVTPQVLSIFPILTLGRHSFFYKLTIHIPGNSHVCLQFFRMSQQIFGFSSQFSNLWSQVNFSI